MNVKERNRLLALGKLDERGLFPHLDLLRSAPRVFSFDFGLRELPDEPGILLIRGPRQYGKSTWLEGALRESVARNGPGSAWYLNGDELRDADHLVQAIEELLPLFSTESRPRRLFVDEITAVRDWPQALKRLADEGALRSVLVVTTGSKATDLRRGAERLPGRKGRLGRTSYRFPPISFAEFHRVCGAELGDRALSAYLLAGGCPAACGEVATTGLLPEFLVEMTRDWIHGEFAASGRPRSSLVAVMACLARFGGTPVGQAKLARESGLANNTVAAGYVELLADLMALGLSPAWDADRQVPIARRPAKFPFTNLLAALAWDPARPRGVAEIEAAPPELQGRWLEWLVAQELSRRAALRGDEAPEVLPHWREGDHKLDFVRPGGTFIEVKRGRTSPLEFSWFPRRHPRGTLVVVGRDRFDAGRLRGLTFEDFLLDPDSDVA